MRINTGIIVLFFYFFCSCCSNDGSVNEEDLSGDGTNGVFKECEKVKSGDGLRFNGVKKKCKVHLRRDSSILYEKGYDNKKRLHGVYKEFHQNGKLKIKGFYHHGNAVKNWRFYNNDGVQKKIKAFLFLGDTSVLNRYYKFDDEGDLIKDKGFYFDIEYPDTIRRGDSLNIRVKFNQKPFDSIIAFVGGFSEYLGVVDSSEIREVESDMPEIQFSVFPEKPGENTLTGQLRLFSYSGDKDGSDFKKKIVRVDATKVDSTVSRVLSRFFFLRYPYYVKEE